MKMSVCIVYDEMYCNVLSILKMIMFNFQKRLRATSYKLDDLRVSQKYYRKLVYGI